MSNRLVSGMLIMKTMVQGAGENSSQLPSTLFQRLPEMGDSSIRGGVAAGGVSPFIKAHTMVPQPEMGMQMRGSSDAAAALQLAKVCLLSSSHLPFLSNSCTGPSAQCCHVLLHNSYAVHMRFVFHGCNLM